jgi:dihydroorotate dehydrogenase electron transfer subunit
MKVDVDATVRSNARLSPDFNVLELEAPAIAVQAQPGQFVMVRTATADGPLLRRPYSLFEILRDADGRPTGFSLFSKRVGAGSRLLYDAVPGQRFACLGPLGRPFELVAPPARAWMVAGGVGLAPFVALSEALGPMGVRSTLFYGARTAGELFCLDLFERLGVDLVLATEDGSRGAHGRVTVPLERALASGDPGAPVTLYACGPEAMLKAVATLASAHGCPAQLSMERLMGCGIGGCYSCVVRVRDGNGGSRYDRACLDGPIFRGEDIVWE